MIPYLGHFHNHGPPQTRRAYIADTVRERWFATRRLCKVNGSLVSNDSYANHPLVQAAIEDWNDR